MKKGAWFIDERLIAVAAGTFENISLRKFPWRTSLASSDSIPSVRERTKDGLARRDDLFRFMVFFRVGTVQHAEIPT